MPDLLREKTVTARKAHECMTCTATAIRPGETYVRTTYVYDGHLYDWVQCTECDQISGLVYNWSSDPDEGVGRDDFMEWAREHHDDPRHGEAARAYLARVRSE